MPRILAGMGQRVRLFMNGARSIPRPSVLWEEGHHAAVQEISSWPGYLPTPLLSIGDSAKQCDIQSIWYKDESRRFGIGSFKALGGAYAVLRILQKAVLSETGHEPTSAELLEGSWAATVSKVTVTTATDGNHGRSVAWGAEMFGCRCVIYIPRTCSPGREAAIARFGATVVRTKDGYDETVRICTREAAATGFVVVSDTSWPGYSEIPQDIMLGYTVMLEEVVLRLPPSEALTHVFVQAGVGGLAASVSAFFSAKLGAKAPRLVVVEPEGAACLFASAQAGKAVPAPPPVATIMAGLDCGEVSTLAWETLSNAATAFMTIPDEVVAPCMKFLASASNGAHSIVAGESAVAGFAALLIAASDPTLRSELEIDSNSRVLVIGTEGDTDPEIYQSLLQSAGQA